MKLRYLKLMLALASSCLINGCVGKKEETAQPKAAPALSGPRHSHSLEPIIIDNPDATIGFLKELSEVGYVLGPIEGKQTFIFGHASFKYIRIGGGSIESIADPKVILEFRKDRGSIMIDHIGPSEGDSGFVLIAPYIDKKKLKWKRNEPSGTQRLSLVKDESEDYLIKAVKYQKSLGNWTTTEFQEGTAVKIRLCVVNNDTNCPV